MLIFLFARRAFFCVLKNVFLFPQYKIRAKNALRALGRKAAFFRKNGRSFPLYCLTFSANRGIMKFTHKIWAVIIYV